jgi:hypothetical protein
MDESRFFMRNVLHGRHCDRVKLDRGAWLEAAGFQASAKVGSVAADCFDCRYTASSSGLAEGRSSRIPAEAALLQDKLAKQDLD